MEFEVNFSKYINEKFSDQWRWEIVEAKNKKEAIKKLKLKHNKDGKHINYLVSCEAV